MLINGLDEETTELVKKDAQWLEDIIDEEKEENLYFDISLSKKEKSELEIDTKKIGMRVDFFEDNEDNIDIYYLKEGIPLKEEVSKKHKKEVLNYVIENIDEIKKTFDFELLSIKKLKNIL